MIAIQIFQNRLKCTGLEARDLANKAKAYAAALVRLQATYTTEKLNVTIQVHRDASAFDSQQLSRKELTTWQRLKRQKLMLRLASPKPMWAVHREAETIFEELEFAREFFDLAIPQDQWLTVLIEALHSAEMLADPEAVAEGRHIYDELSSGYHQRIAHDLGLSRPWKEKL